MKQLMMRSVALAVAIVVSGISIAAETPALTPAEKESAKKIYFERCAGCHGVLRKGATGKNLEPEWKKTLPDGTVQDGGTLKLGTSRLEKIIAHGTEGGMVNFDDLLS